MYNYSDYTALSDCVLYKAYINVQIFHLTSWFLACYYESGPSISGLFGPINMGMFFSLLTSVKIDLFPNP